MTRPHYRIEEDMLRITRILGLLHKQIQFQERALTLLVIALILMTGCNVVIILRVFFMEAP